MMSTCHGNGADHCCYVNGAPCQYLQENTVAGRRWACGLYAELGDWNAVIADERYQTNLRPVWEVVEQVNGLPSNSFNCHPWGPGTNQCCYRGQ